MIWAIILAAGESKRMGKSKLLLPYAEKTIIETVIENIIHSDVSKTLVVLGAGGEKIQEKIREYPVEIAVNRNYRKGMLSSVQLGFQRVPEGARAALVLLGDQPAVSTSVINTVISAFESSRKGIVLPVYERSRGHPVLIDMKYRKQIESLSPEIGLRGLVYGSPGDTEEVSVDSSSILRDIDDLDDYQRELLKSKK